MERESKIVFNANRNFCLDKTLSLSGNKSTEKSSFFMAVKNSKNIKIAITLMNNSANSSKFRQKVIKIIRN